MSENARARRIPTGAQLREPIRKILEDCKTWKFMEIVEKIADRFNLTAADRERVKYHRYLGEKSAKFKTSVLAPMQQVSNPRTPSANIYPFKPSFPQIYRTKQSCDTAPPIIILQSGSPQSNQGLFSGCPTPPAT